MSRSKRGSNYLTPLKYKRILKKSITVRMNITFSGESLPPGLKTKLHDQFHARTITGYQKSSKS